MPTDETHDPTASPQPAPLEPDRTLSAIARTGSPDSTWSQPVDGELRPAGSERPRLPSVPGYVLLEEIGRGGMGVVYKARQDGLNRLVALKMIRPSDHADPQALVRFLAEAEAVGSIRHPHVVQVFELGTAEVGGDPFLALEYLPGGTLADRLAAGGRVAADDAAGLMAKLAHGVAAAHGLGIVHRDLKPGNVLFDEQGEPKVADFGLARRGPRANVTVPGQLLGTPAYMAPEQASWSGEFVGPAADVWALGVILYECLTGRRPFPGRDLQLLLAQVRTEDPDPPHVHAPELARDLERVCMKCLEKDARDRYATAAELAADLGRFLRHEPISARTTGWVERAARWARRKPTAASAWVLGSAAAALAGVTVALALAFSTATQERGNAEAARDQLARAQTRTEAARHDAVRALDQLTVEKRKVDAAQNVLAREQVKLAQVEYGRTVQVAYQEYRENYLLAALALLNDTRKDLRGWEWRYVRRLCTPPLITLRGSSRSTTPFSPDGSRIVTVDDDTVRVWDARTGAELLEIKGKPRGVRSVAFNPDGTRLMTTQFYDLRVWDATTGAQVFTINSPALNDSAAFSPDGGRIVTTGRGMVCLWDAKTGTKLLTLKGNTDLVRSAAFSPNGGRIVTASLAGTARVWDATTGTELLTFQNHIGGVSSAAFSPDGTRIVSAGSDTARIWDARTGIEIFMFGGLAGGVHGAAFSPDGARVVTASWDGTVRVWSALTGDELLTIKPDSMKLYSVAWSPDGHRLATFGDGVRVWDIETRAGAVCLRHDREVTVRLANPGLDGVEAVAIRQYNEGKVHSATFSTDGARVLTTSYEARVWDAKTGTEVFALWPNTKQFSSAAFSPDGTRIVTAGADSTAQVWDAQTRDQLLTLKGAERVSSSGFSPDGTRIVTTSGSMAVVWDAGTGGELFVMQDTVPMSSAGFSPDGTRIVTASGSMARVWDAKTGGELLVIKEAAPLSSVTFSSDGTRIVTASGSMARVWDAKTGGELLTLKRHARLLRAAAFSPDGTRIVTGADNGTVRIWDTQTGTDLLVLRGHARAVTSVMWSQDGRQIVTGSEDGTARIWDAGPVD